MPTHEPSLLHVDSTARSRLNLLLSVAAWQAILACVFLSMWIGQAPQTALAGIVLHWAGIVGCIGMCGRAILPRAGDSSGELLFSGIVPLLFSGMAATGCYFAEEERFAAAVAVAGHAVLLAALIRNYTDAGRERAAEHAGQSARDTVGDSWKRLLEGSVGQTVLLSPNGVTLISGLDGNPATSRAFPPHRSFLTDVHPDDLPAFQTHLREALTTARVSDEPIRFRYRFPDGQYRPLEAPARKIETSEFRGVVLHLRDRGAIDALEAENGSIRSERDTLDALKDRLLLDQQTIVGERDRLRAESLSRLGRIDTLASQAETLTREVAETREGATRFASRSSALEGELAEANARLHERTAERDSAGQRFASVRGQLDAAEEKIELGSREIARVQTDLDDHRRQVSVLHSTRVELELETAALQKARDELHARATDRGTALDALKIQYDRLETQLGQVRSEMSSETARLTAERDRVAGELDTTRGNLDRTYGTLEQLRETSQTRAGELEAETQTMERRMIAGDRLETVGAVTREVAGEFSNLLLNIIGNVSLAQKQLPPASPTQQLLGETQAAALHARDLCGQLLPDDTPALAEAILTPEEILRESHLLVHLIAGRDNRLEFDLKRTSPLSCDAGSLRQIVIGLIRQATHNLEATRPGGGTIRLRVRPGTPETEFVRIEVEDDAETLTPERAREVVDSSLLPVAKILRAHRGRLEIAPTDGGNVVRVDLPVSPVAAAASPVVLVVDPDRSVLTVASRLLVGSGCMPLVAQSVAEAINQMKGHSGTISKVLLDTNLPAPGSAELYRRMKELRPDVTILLSGFEPESKARETIPIAAESGYLRKPWKPEEMVRRVR